LQAAEFAGNAEVMGEEIVNGDYPRRESHLKLPIELARILTLGRILILERDTIDFIVTN
jgi:hypothetical protein